MDAATTVIDPSDPDVHVASSSAGPPSAPEKFPFSELGLRDPPPVGDLFLRLRETNGMISRTEITVWRDSLRLKLDEATRAQGTRAELEDLRADIDTLTRFLETH